MFKYQKLKEEKVHILENWGLFGNLRSEHKYGQVKLLESMMHCCLQETIALESEHCKNELYNMT